MDVSKMRPTVQDLVQAALLFSPDDPRRRQLLSLLAFDEQALRLLGNYED